MSRIHLAIESLLTQIQGLPHEPPYHLYLLIDSAQAPQLLTYVQNSMIGIKTICLFSNLQGGGLEKAAPYLATLPPFTETKFWESLFDLASQNPASFSLIATPSKLEYLRDHFMRFLDVRLEGGLDMMLAFWDPVILACLVGQEDDQTLYVAGPVFSSVQKNAFLAHIHSWWYWDRESNIHRIKGTDPLEPIEDNVTPLKLTEKQEYILVEAGLPDTLLYYLNLNTPALLEVVKPELYYQFVCGQIENARDFGLETIGDMVRFLCIVLIYKDRMDSDPEIQSLLAQIKAKKLSMEDAMKLMPE